VRNADGTFTRTLKDGTRIEFDTRGLHTATVDRNGNTTRYSYDASDRLTSVTDPRGRVTTLAYSGGRLASSTDPVGRITTFTHDASGNLRQITDPDGSTRQFSYDARHRLTAQTSKNGAVTTYEYNFAGRHVQSHLSDGSTRQFAPSALVGLVDVSSGLGTSSNPAPVVRPAELIARFTDGNGHETRFTTDRFGDETTNIDALGRQTTTERDIDSNATRITRPNGAVTSMTYDVRGNLLTLTEESITATTRLTYEATFNQITSVTDANGNATTVNYDVKGNLIEVLDATATRTMLRYEEENCLGQLTSVTRAAGLPEENTTTFAYDPTSCNRVRMSDPLDNITAVTYNAAGNVTQLTDPEGRVMRLFYDAMNRVTKEVDEINLDVDPPCGSAGVTCYGYDAKGNLTRLIDANGHITTFDYDGLDRLIRRVDPLGNAETFTYDGNGNLLSATDRQDQRIAFAYDAVNQVIRKTLPGDLITNYAYDALGNLTEVTDPDSKLTLGYDLASRLTSSSTAGSPSQPNSLITYTYDKNGNRLTMEDPTGTTTYAYDRLNQTTQVINPGGQTTGFDYDALSRRTQKTFANGTTASSTYDQASRLLRLIHARGATILSSFNYTYDQAGSRKTLIQERSAIAVAPERTYIYDAANRLIAVTQPTPLPPLETYTYDPVGNRLRRDTQTTDAIFDAANRLLQDDGFCYDYDANGNLTGKTAKVAGACTDAITTYTYDAENRLIRLDLPGGTVAEYRYDGLSRRIEKQVNGQITRYLYDGQNVLLETNGTGTIVARYTHGPRVDEPLLLERDLNANGTFEATERFVYHADSLGSVTDLTDSTGAVARAYTYDAFGQILGQVGTLANPYSYTGREFDAESGLFYYRARHYDAHLGRFLQEDPLWFAGGDINLYAYVANDPVNLKDPYGLLTCKQKFTICEIGLGIGGAIGLVITGTSIPPLIAADVATAIALCKIFKEFYCEPDPPHPSPKSCPTDEPKCFMVAPGVFKCTEVH
jgi:RHS repeat-associated protein